MANFPEYQSNRGVSTPGMMDTTSGLEVQARVNQNIDNEASQFLQKTQDDLEAKKGTLDAETQGKDFKSQLDLTEGGRAYNAAGLPVANSIAHSQMATQFNQYYENELKQGVNPASMQSMQAQFKTFSQTTIDGADPKLRPGLMKSAATMGAAYTTRLQGKIDKIQQRQAIATNLSTQQSLQDSANNLAASGGVDSLSEKPLNASAISAQEKRNQALAQVPISVSSGAITPKEGVDKISDIKYNYTSSAYAGEAQKISSSVGTCQTNNNDGCAVAHLKQINALKEKVYADQNNLTPSQKAKIVTQINGQYKAATQAFLLNSPDANKDTTEAVAGIYAGNPPSATQLANIGNNLGSENNNQKIAAAHLGADYLKSGNINNIGQLQQDIIDVKNGKLFPEGDKTPQTLRNSTNNKVTGILNQRIKQTKDDPNQRSIDTYSTQAFNHIVSGIGTADGRVAFQTALNSPTSSLTQAYPPQVQAAYSKYHDGLKRNCGSIGGSPEECGGDTNATMAQQGALISSLSSEGQQQALANKYANDPQGFSSWAHNMIRTKNLKADVFETANLVNFGAPQNVIDDAKKSRDFQSTLTTDSAKKSYQDLKNQARKAYQKQEPTYAGYIFGKDTPGKNLANSYNTSESNPVNTLKGEGVQQVIVNYAAYQAYKTGQPIDIAKAGEDLYSNIKVKGNLRFPKTIMHQTNGGLVSAPLDENETENNIKGLQQMLPQLVDDSKYQQAYNKKFGLTGSGSSALLKQNIISGAHAVTSPDNKSVYFISGTGNVLLDKKGNRIGFNYADQDALTSKFGDYNPLTGKFSLKGSSVLGSIIRGGEKGAEDLQKDIESRRTIGESVLRSGEEIVKSSFERGKALAEVLKPNSVIIKGKDAK